MTRKGSASGSPSSHLDQPPNAFEQEFPGGSESANACMIALVRTYGASMTVLNTAMREYGLSGAGRQALAVLEGADEPLSPTVIAERLFVTTASTTSLLDTLQRRGLVSRLPDPHDRRRQRVSLTEEGQRVVDDFLPEMVAIQTALMAGLTEGDRARLLRSLGAIQDAIAGLDVGAVIAAAPARAKPRG